MEMTGNSSVDFTKENNFDDFIKHGCNFHMFHCAHLWTMGRNL